jgi:hypothetical protein
MGVVRGLQLIFNDYFPASIDIASFDIAGERPHRRFHFDKFEFQTESLTECRQITGEPRRKMRGF